MPSRKSKSLLTPRHPLWAAFHAALGRQLRGESVIGTDPVCSHKRTMPATLKALVEVGLAQRNVLASRQFFRDCGLTCDCAVWFHPDVLLEEKRPVWEDAEGNFDANTYYWAEIRPGEE